MATPFSTFSSAHLIAIAVTLAAPAALGLAMRSGRRPRLARALRFGLAGILIAAWAMWYVAWYRRGWFAAGSVLPMQLCDWASVTAIVTLLRPNLYTYELTYFWALAGTVQALLTPDIPFDFPDITFVVFFLLHGGTIAAAIYMTLAFRLRPVPMSLVRVALWSFVYLGAALAVNAIFDTNFGYLSGKPAQPSLLDYLGPWPDYIFAVGLIAMLSYAIYYAPFFVADLVRARKRKAAM